MFLCILLGGFIVGITIGLLDVLVFHLDAISSQKTVSAGVDLALGLLLLAVGALVATGRLHGRRKQPAPAGNIQPETAQKEKKDSVCSNGPGPPRPETVAAKLDRHVRHHPGHIGRPYKRVIVPARTGAADTHYRQVAAPSA
jgi:hypothetical protein